MESDILPGDLRNVPEAENCRLAAASGNLAAARLTSVLGIAFAVLFLGGLAMLAGTPGPRSTNQELVTFYASGAQRRLVLSGLYVLPLAAVAFLWFIAALRQ